LFSIIYQIRGRCAALTDKQVDDAIDQPVHPAETEYYDGEEKLGDRPQIFGVRHIAAKINRARTRRERREREGARPM